MDHASPTTGGGGQASRGRRIALCTSDHRCFDAGKLRARIRATDPPIRSLEFQVAADRVDMRRRRRHAVPFATIVVGGNCRRGVSLTGIGTFDPPRCWCARDWRPRCRIRTSPGKHHREKTASRLRNHPDRTPGTSPCATPEIIPPQIPMGTFPKIAPRSALKP